MTFEAILYEVEDNILTIIFNRPDAMNAFSGPMFGELFTALDMADADDEVKAIIITGAGRHFARVPTSPRVIKRGKDMKKGWQKLVQEMVAVKLPGASGGV